MKKFLGFGLLALLALAAVAPNAGAQVATGLHYASGIFNSVAYNQFRATVIGGPYASGSVTIEVTPAFVTLPDGYSFSPWSTSNPVIFGLGGPNQETLTPSAVSTTTGGQCPGPGSCELLTITAANTHGEGDIIASGSSGYDEALLDAGNNGGGLVYWQVDTGQVALSTSATTTTLCTTCIPSGVVVIGAVARVTTTITGSCTGWELGDGTTATRFTANNAGLTAGTVSNADLQTTSGVASTTTGMLTAAAKSLVSTCAAGDPSAGAIHARLFGWGLATPTN